MSNAIQYHLRLPLDLHFQLTTEAEQQGVSLNTLMIALLAGAIGFKLTDNYEH